MNTEFISALVNLRHPLTMPTHRVTFHALRPHWERPRLDHMHERIEQGMVVYDVGAEEGDFTALYGKWTAPHGTVVPFEPQPAYWPSIRGTWEANELKPPPWTFAGFAADSTEMYPPKGDGHDPLNDAWPAYAEGEIKPDFGFRHLAQQSADTPRTTIDDFVAETACPPDAIVCDIEGAEYAAMKGAAETLSNPLRDRPAMVWLSVHPPTMKKWYRKTVKQLNELMEHYGYTPELIAESAGEDFWFYSR